MLVWRPMGRRARKHPPAPCPACDTPIEDSQLAGEPPACPACGQPLAPVHVAGFWRRSLGALLDTLVLALAAAPLNWALWALVADRPAPEIRLGLAPLLQVLTLEPREILQPVAPFLIMAGLYLVLFWGLSGHTPGQRLLGMQIIDRRGQRVGPLAALIRLGGLVAGMVVGALGAIWIAFDPEKRGFHDHVAGTYVVRTS